MKKEFEDESYIEVQHSSKPGKLFVVIAAKSQENVRETVVNSVEISIEDFNNIISDLNVEKVATSKKKSKSKKKTNKK